MGVRQLNSRLRERLKRPFGRIVTGREAARIAKGAAGKVVAVGDVCSHVLISSGLTPHISIYDRKSLRERINRKIVELIERAYKKRYAIRNDAGTLNEDAVGLIRDALGESEGCRIEVDGEEDMLALAAMMVAGDGDIVMYGQPHEGVAVIVAEEGVRAEAMAIFEEMGTSTGAN